MIGHLLSDYNNDILINFRDSSGRIIRLFYYTPKQQINEFEERPNSNMIFLKRVIPCLIILYFSLVNS